MSDHEKLEAGRTSLAITFRNLRADLDSRISRLQTTLEILTMRADEEAEERKKLLVSEKCLKVQLRHTADDSKEPKDLQYKLDGVIAKECQAQNTETSF